MSIDDKLIDKHFEPQQYKECLEQRKKEDPAMYEELRSILNDIYKNDLPLYYKSIRVGQLKSYAEICFVNRKTDCDDMIVNLYLRAERYIKCLRDM